MAGRKRKIRKRIAKRGKKPYLYPHDEHKIVLFGAGIVFGLALANLVQNIYYSSLAYIAIAITLYFVEIDSRKRLGHK